jgi:hypothetical protein
MINLLRKLGCAKLFGEALVALILYRNIINSYLCNGKIVHSIIIPCTLVSVPLADGYRAWQ